MKSSARRAHTVPAREPRAHRWHRRVAAGLVCVMGLAQVVLGACTAEQDRAAASPDPPATSNPHVVATTPTPSARIAIAAEINRIAPHARVQTIRSTPIDGLYQAVAGGKVFYVTGDGRYVLRGDVYDARTRVSLNDATMARLRREAIANLGRGQVIRYGPVNPKYKVTVFTDVDCPYCRAFHANMSAINGLDIAVDYLFWPRTGLGTPSAQKAINVWCAADRQAALTFALAGGVPPAAECTSAVAHDFDLGTNLGVDGTPAVIADDGTLLGGYLTPLELLRRLRQADASLP